MADLWDQLVKKYPRYTIAILLVYALLVSAYTIYSSVRSYYIELNKPYLEDLAEACGNISEIAARISRSESYPADKVMSLGPTFRKSGRAKKVSSSN